MYMCDSAGSHRGQNGAPYPLELELLAFVSHSMWVLWSELQSSGREVNVLSPAEIGSPYVTLASLEITVQARLASSSGKVFAYAFFELGFKACATTPSCYKHSYLLSHLLNPIKCFGCVWTCKCFYQDLP